MAHRVEQLIRSTRKFLPIPGFIARD